MNSAFVYLENEHIGDLHLEEDKIGFVYQPEWRKKGFAISHSLPLNGEYSTTTAHQFFANLLPEGALRDAICRKLKISADNDWQLLMCLGRESAGALTIDIEERDVGKKSEYEKLSAADLNRFSQSKSVMPQIITNEATRLSLAGAQDKMAVYFDGSDFWLPLNGAPTNTILKFENDDYRQITVNEVFMNHLAQKLGFGNCTSSNHSRYSGPNRHEAKFC